MLRWFSALLASAALIACGLVHGYWTDRWHPPVETAAAAGRLEALPLDLGDWQGTEIDMKPGEGGAGIAGCIQRRYVHRSGIAVSMYLVCGRPGPVSIHIPEVCYGANGFMVGSRSRTTITEHGDTMWKVDAVRSNVSEETRLRLYWGWHDGSAWKAADDARLEFARRPVLHKLYVVRELTGVNEGDRREPCQEFLTVLLPALEKALFTPGS
jgi:hypothetical protein